MALEDRRRKDIEKQINDIYQLLSEWEEKRNYATNPTEQKKAENEIERLKGIINLLKEELEGLNSSQEGNKIERLKNIIDGLKSSLSDLNSSQEGNKTERLKNIIDGLEAELNKPSSQKRKWWAYTLAFLVLAILGYFGYQRFFETDTPIIKIPPDSTSIKPPVPCEEQTSKILIQVADFSAEDETFARLLAYEVDSRLQLSEQEVYTYRLKDYIDPQDEPKTLEAKIQNHQKRYCDFSGITVYGDQEVNTYNEYSLLHCRVKFTNLDLKDTIIYAIKSIEFKVIKQLELVAPFLAGVACLYLDCPQKSIVELEKIKQTASPQNEELKAYSSFFLGSIYLKQENYKKAYLAYTEADSIIERKGKPNPAPKANLKETQRILLTSYFPELNPSGLQKLYSLNEKGFMLSDLHELVKVDLKIDQLIQSGNDKGKAFEELKQEKYKLSGKITDQIDKLKIKNTVPLPPTDTITSQDLNDEANPVDLSQMIYIPGGTFQMGSEEGDDDEKPVHTVTLSDYYIGRTELTVAQYQAYANEVGLEMPDAPFWGWQADHPMIYVDWYEAARYCNWRSQKEGYTAYYIIDEKNQVSYNSQSKGYRLPSEAQWEFAARGGNKGKDLNHRYSGGDKLDGLAWYAENSNHQTHPVAQKSPNALGLYDMSGNVYEWCDDWYAGYPSEAQTNPIYLQGGDSRVLRGGSCRFNASFCRVANRNLLNPDYRTYNYGFRLSRTP